MTCDCHGNRPRYKNVKEGDKVVHYCQQGYFSKYPPKPIRKLSKKRAKELKEYSKMKIPENQICQFPRCINPATDKHHPQGRENKRLLDPVKYLCRSHHQLITDNTPLAIELRLSVSKHKKAG